MSDPMIGRIQFNDGVWRDIHEGLDGRQYVHDDEGERVFGVWLIPEDEPDLPLIVNAAEPHE